MKKLIVLALFLSLLSEFAFGATLNLKATWTPNTESNVASYRLYRTDGDRSDFPRLRREASVAQTRRTLIGGVTPSWK